MWTPRHRTTLPSTYYYYSNYYCYYYHCYHHYYRFDVFPPLNPALRPLGKCSLYNFLLGSSRSGPLTYSPERVAFPWAFGGSPGAALSGPPEESPQHDAGGMSSKRFWFGSKWTAKSCPGASSTRFCRIYSMRGDRILSTCGYWRTSIFIVAAKGRLMWLWFKTMVPKTKVLHPAEALNMDKTVIRLAKKHHSHNVPCPDCACLMAPSCSFHTPTSKSVTGGVELSLTHKSCSNSSKKNVTYSVNKCQLLRCLKKQETTKEQNFPNLKGTQDPTQKTPKISTLSKQTGRSSRSLNHPQQEKHFFHLVGTPSFEEVPWNSMEEQANWNEALLSCAKGWHL